MSDDLHTYIEPELEARITALVLGEVSEFDVEELEQIIASKPELQIFRRRIEAMHDLLGEAVKPEIDENWQLSEKRRAELRRTFSKKVESVPAVSKTVSQAQWRAGISIAACLVVCLVIFSMMTPVAMKSLKSERAVTEHLSYQSAASELEDDYQDIDRDGLSKGDDIVWAPEDDQVPSVGDLPASGPLFKGKKESRKDARLAETNAKPVQKSQSVTRAVPRKPVAPSSSMAKLIASNTKSDPAIPVPEVAVVPDPSAEFGVGDDFGDGWGDGGGERFEGDQELGNQVGALAMSDSDEDPFGGVVEEEVEVVREYNYHAEYEPPELPNSIEVAGEKKKSSFPVTPATPVDFESRATGVALESGEAKYMAGGEVAKKEARRDDFISPVEDTKIPGIPTGGTGAVTNTATAGLRSGDYATTRNSIDAILNNPDRTSSIAQKEIARRASLVGAADQSLLGGRSAYAGKDYEQASKSYREALALLPPGPAHDERRRSYQGHLNDANVALAQKFRRVGKYDEAKEVLQETLRNDPANIAAKKQLSYLEDPIQISPALTYEHQQAVDKVRKNLYKGEGYYNLGQYAEAEEEMKDVLKTDPYNKAARRWLEKIASTKSDYYRAAYDHTRANLLAEVDSAWEMAVPQQVEGKPEPVPARKAKPATGKQGQLEQELQKQSDQVAALRQRLMDQAEKSGLIYMETEQGDRTIGVDSGLVEMAEKELYSAERDKEQLTFQINKLLSLEKDELVAVVADLPDVGFKEYHSKYTEAKVDLAKLRQQGFGEKHPDVVTRQAEVKDLEGKLERRALSVRDSLKHQLSLVEGRVKKMQEVVNQKSDQGTATARNIQEFNILRKEYQTALAIRDNMQVELDTQQVRAKGKKVEKPAEKPIPAPKPALPLPEETKTSEQPFSTFSLNVADVSFKLAKVALLEKGQWPEASKVRTEEFVNAFDYGDPSPRRGEPVACTIEQSAHPFLQQRNLLRVGMKTAALGRSTPLRLTVLLDNSGSMEREDREASVLAAMQVLAAQLGPQDQITLVGFARQPRLLADRVSGDQAGKLVNIVANTPSEGGTNIEEALRLARRLAKRQHSEGAQDRVVLITDGVANLGNTVPEQLSREIEIMRQEGIAFDACGVGAEDLNDEILEALTRKGDGRYYFLNRPEDADSGFAKQLAGALSPAAKNVKVQVVFNPKRVSKYRLLGFEKHRLKKEDFRNDKVDAAEMASEEAGNAVYQIQADPNGEGELGEVFVRFLDANTGRMVERSWPLPYEPQTQAFDQTTPSMQLAGIASMLGEKLHGTDAGSVRFEMIAQTLGQLRAHYQADRKVQDLIRMCEKVK